MLTFINRFFWFFYDASNSIQPVHIAHPSLENFDLRLFEHSRPSSSSAPYDSDLLQHVREQLKRRRWANEKKRVKMFDAYNVPAYNVDDDDNINNNKLTKNTSESCN